MVALRAGVREERRFEAGQALVEMALVAPLLMLFLSAVVDVGRFMFVEANVGSAADALARQLESTPDMTSKQAGDYLTATFPNLAPAAKVSLGAASARAEQVGYRVFDSASASFKARPTQVSQDKVVVAVDYDGQWLNPGLVGAAELLAGDGGFHIRRTAIATIDTTLETW